MTARDDTTQAATAVIEHMGHTHQCTECLALMKAFVNTIPAFMGESTRKVLTDVLQEMR